MDKNEVALLIKYNEEDKLENLFLGIKEKGYEMEIIEYKRKFKPVSFINIILSGYKDIYIKYYREIWVTIISIFFLLLISVTYTFTSDLAKSLNKNDDGGYDLFLKKSIQKNITMGVSGSCLKTYSKTANNIIKKIYTHNRTNIGYSPKEDNKINNKINKSLNGLCEGFVNE